MLACFQTRAQRGNNSLSYRLLALLALENSQEDLSHVLPQSTYQGLGKYEVKNLLYDPMKGKISNVLSTGEVVNYDVSDRNKYHWFGLLGSIEITI